MMMSERGVPDDSPPMGVPQVKQNLSFSPISAPHFEQKGIKYHQQEGNTHCDIKRHNVHKPRANSEWRGIGELRFSDTNPSSPR